MHTYTHTSTSTCTRTLHALTTEVTAAVLQALEACVEKSEAELQMKMAKLADTDKKEEMLQDGSF